MSFTSYHLNVSLLMSGGVNEEKIVIRLNWKSPCMFENQNFIFHNFLKMHLDNTYGLLNLLEFKCNCFNSLFQAEYEFKNSPLLIPTRIC